MLSGEKKINLIFTWLVSGILYPKKVTYFVGSFMSFLENWLSEQNEEHPHESFSKEDDKIHEFVSPTHELPSFQRIAGYGKVKNADCGKIFKGWRCKESGEKIVQHNWCYRLDCPICYSAAIFKNASRSIKKVEALAQLYPLYHWTLSLDKSKFTSEFMTETIVQKTWKKITDVFLKRKIPCEKTLIASCQKAFGSFEGLSPSATKSLLELTINDNKFDDTIGMLSCFHPYRLKDSKGIGHDEKGCDKKSLHWEWGPHFHIVSNQDFLDTSSINAEFNIVIKRISAIADSEDDIIKVIAYEGSHAYVNDSRTKTHKKPTIFRWAGTWGNQVISKLLLQIKKKGHLLHCSCDSCKEHYDIEDRSLMIGYDITAIETSREIIERGTLILHKITTEVIFPEESNGEIRGKSDYFYIPLQMKAHRKEIPSYLRHIGFLDSIQEVFSRFESFEKQTLLPHKERKTSVCRVRTRSFEI